MGKKAKMIEWFKPHLLQRLEASFDRRGPINWKSLPAKLSTQEARNLRKEIYQADYMGSAEYEFGAFMQAVSFIVHNKADFVVNRVVIPRADIAKPTWRTEKAKAKDDITVWQYVHKDHALRAEAAIREIAAGKLCTLDGSHFEHFAWPETQRLPSRLVGWLEETNGWFAFLHEDIFRDVVESFLRQEG